MNEFRLQKLKEMEVQKPDDAFLKFAIAQEYVSAERDDEALELYKILLEKFSDYLPTYYQFGQLLERTAKFDAAKIIYKKGVEIAQSAGDMKTERELREALQQLED